jgi:hypothetical protein
MRMRFLIDFFSGTIWNVQRLGQEVREQFG